MHKSFLNELVHTHHRFLERFLHLGMEIFIHSLQHYIPKIDLSFRSISRKFPFTMDGLFCTWYMFLLSLLLARKSCSDRFFDTSTVVFLTVCTWNVSKLKLVYSASNIFFLVFNYRNNVFQYFLSKLQFLIVVILFQDCRCCAWKNCAAQFKRLLLLW